MFISDEPPDVQLIETLQESTESSSTVNSKMLQQFCYNHWYPKLTLLFDDYW